MTCRQSCAVSARSIDGGAARCRLAVRRSCPRRARSCDQQGPGGPRHEVVSRTVTVSAHRRRSSDPFARGAGHCGEARTQQTRAAVYRSCNGHPVAIVSPTASADGRGRPRARRPTAWSAATDGCRRRRWRGCRQVTCSLSRCVVRPRRRPVKMPPEMASSPACRAVPSARIDTPVRRSNLALSLAIASCSISSADEAVSDDRRVPACASKPGQRTPPTSAGLHQPGQSVRSAAAQAVLSLSVRQA